MSGDRLGMGRARASRRTAGADQRFVHDLADGASTAAALRAATETAVNLTGTARRRRAHRSAHFVVTQDVAGADDHLGHGFPSPDGFQVMAAGPIVKAKLLFKNVLKY